MAKSFLRKKKIENVPAERQSTANDPRNSQQPPPAARLERPRDPDFRPILMSIMDQEWVHQVDSAHV
jgi:hypothetical protein